jgi:anaerobic selenocysteine-containing dehydrogenase
MIGPKDAERLGISDGDRIRIGNRRGAVILHARLTEGLKPGVVVAEGIWPNDAYPDGRGINTLTGADAVAPYGGAAFHDTAVWVRKD